MTNSDCPKRLGPLNCISNQNELADDKATEFRKLSYLKVASPVCNIPHLTNIDVDRNMPTDQNFNYYTTHNFHFNYDIIKCSSDPKLFSAMHCNIRSLQGNHYNFVQMLSELNFPFSLIGLSEIKFKLDKDILAIIELPDYDFISQPSLPYAGGVGFYTNKNLNYSILSDLTTTEDDFEALWIEINVDGQSNIICGVVYRHPNGNLDNFMSYISRTIEHINLQNKYSLIMGDFNIDLLKSSEPCSDNFINALGSFFYQPHILQPTRITDDMESLFGVIHILSHSNHYIYYRKKQYELLHSPELMNTQLLCSNY